MGRYSFSKADRMLKRRDFVGLSRDGKRVENKAFIAIYTEAATGTSRLGITATKRFGCAVRRNRVKRYVREYFRSNRHQLSAPRDLNIIAKKKAVHLTSQEAYSALEQLFSRLA